MGSQSTQIEAFLKEWRSDCPYVVAHTSGSTGAPKEIRLPKADMAVSARATCRRFGITSQSVLWLPLSVDYIAGKMMAVRADLSGARLVADTPSRTLTPPDLPIDLIAIVPQQVNGLVEAVKMGAVIRNVIVGGGPLSPPHEQALKVLPCRVFATYGMTETCSHVALRSITDAEDAFTAMPGITFATDERDCLTILCPEYSFKQLQTNDIVQLLSPTCFRWLGRADNAIITGGLKVIPELIEQKIAPLIPSGVDFAISSRPSERWGREVVLVVAVGPPQTPPQGEGLTKSLEAPPLGEGFGVGQSGLLPHELPKAIVAVPALPRASHGKLDRPALARLLSNLIQKQ